jgi:hypothetical protein
MSASGGVGAGAGFFSGGAAWLEVQTMAMTTGKPNNHARLMTFPRLRRRGLC